MLFYGPTQKLFAAENFVQSLLKRCLFEKKCPDRFTNFTLAQFWVYSYHAQHQSTSSRAEALNTGEFILGTTLPRLHPPLISLQTRQVSCPQNSGVPSTCPPPWKNRMCMKPLSVSSAPCWWQDGLQVCDASGLRCRIECTRCRLLRPIIPGVRQSVCHVASLCKHGWTDRGPACGGNSRDPTTLY